MIYSLITFIITVYPFAVRNYLKRDNIKILQKILHLLIALGIYSLFLISVVEILFDLKNYGFNGFLTSETYEYYSKDFDLITSIVYFLVALYSVGLSLNIASKGHSRKLLIFSSPIIVIVTTIKTTKYLLEQNQTGDFLRISVMVLVFNILVFSLINIYYSIPYGRCIFEEVKRTPTKWAKPV